MPKILDGSESILCVPSSSLPPLGLEGTGFFRFKPDRGASLDLVLASAEFRPRTAELEADPSWRQVVSYVVACNRGRVATYRRGKAGAETRLHDRRTFGAGGHLNHWDMLELPRAWRLGCGNCARREILEEFGVQPPSGLNPVGVLLDDRDPVGQVHLGLVVPWFCTDKQRERLRFGTGIEFVGWCDEREVRRHGDFEGWSEILIPHLSQIVGPSPVDPALGLAVLGAPVGGRPGPGDMPPREYLRKVPPYGGGFWPQSNGGPAR